MAMADEFASIRVVVNTNCYLRHGGKLYSGRMERLSSPDGRTAGLHWVGDELWMTPTEFRALTMVERCRADGTPYFVNDGRPVVSQIGTRDAAGTIVRTAQPAPLMPPVLGPTTQGNVPVAPAVPAAKPAAPATPAAAAKPAKPTVAPAAPSAPSPAPAKRRQPNAD